MILKVQLPITTNDPEPKALIYDKSRKVMVQVPITSDITDRMDGELKKFFDGYFLDNGTPVLGKEVENPGW